MLPMQTRQSKQYKSLNLNLGGEILMIIFVEQCWWEKFSEEKPNLIYLTLFAPAYLSISSNRGGGTLCPPSISRGWVELGFQFILEITWLGVIYYIQKDS